MELSAKHKVKFVRDVARYDLDLDKIRLFFDSIDLTKVADDETLCKMLDQWLAGRYRTSKERAQVICCVSPGPDDLFYCVDLKGKTYTATNEEMILLDLRNARYVSSTMA